MENEKVLPTVESLENEKLKQENENLKNSFNYLSTRIGVLNEDLSKQLNLVCDLKVGNIILQNQIKVLQESVKQKKE